MNRQAKELTKAMLSTIASLLLSVKNTVIEYQAKLFPFAKAFLGLCLSGLLLVSCASGQKRAGNIWWADYTQNSREDCSIDGQKMGEYWFNDSKNKTYGYQIPQGEHDVGIGIRWSNGFVDSTQLTLDVKEGRKYTIYMHELQEGQDPNAPVDLTREYQEQTYKGNAGGTFLNKDNVSAFLFLAGVSYPPLGLAILTVKVIVGTMQENRSKYSSQPNKANIDSQDASATTEDHQTDTMADTTAQPSDNREAQPSDTTSEIKTKTEDTATTTVSQLVVPPPAPTARPFDGCCYVWVEDSDTKEVVAGTRLPGAGQ